MNEQEILQNIKDAARDDLNFHSNRGKKERERWVVTEFLKFQKIEHDHREITSPEQSSKTDVEFRDSRFQVKEITAPGIKRSKYFKDQYNSINAASKLEEIKLATDSQDTPDIARIYELVILETVLSHS